MNKNDSIANRPIIVIVSIVLAVFSLLIMFKSGNIDSEHNCIVLLPISVILGSFLILIFKVADYFRIASLCTYFLFLFRHTIVAAVSVNGNYYVETSPSLYINKYNTACILMFIEYLLMVFMLCIGLQRTQSEKKYDKYFNDKNNQSLFIFISLALIFCFLMIVIFPSLKSNFFLFFGSTESRINIKNQYSSAASSVPGIIFYPFVAVVEWLRISIPIFVIVLVFHSEKSKIIKVFVSIGIILFNLCITTHVQITGLFVLAIIILYLMEQKSIIKHVLWLPVTIGVIYVFIIAVSNYSGIGSDKMLSRVLQNYFCGPSNVAAGLSMPRTNSFSKFFIDLIYSNNFISAVLGVGLKMTSTEDYFMFINDNTRSSIFPSISQAAYYYSVYIAPLYSALVIYFITKLENLAYRISNRVYRVLFIFCAFKMAVCLNMYFAYSVYSVLWDLIIPYFFIAWFGYKYVIKFANRRVSIFGI